MNEEEADLEVDDETLDLYALGALDADEHARVAAVLRSDPALAQRVAQTQEALAVLGASTPVTPPPSMRAAVLAALDDVPQEPREAVRAPDAGPGDTGRGDTGPADEREAAPGPADELGARRERRAADAEGPTRRSAMRYAVAAAAVVVAGTGGYAAWSAARSQRESVSAVAERIDAAPDVQVVPASDASGAWASSELRWSPSVGEAVITAPQALPSPSGGVYQVWRVARPGAAPSPVVDFDGSETAGGAEGVVVPGGAGGAAAVAVSREPGPGATTPTTPLVATYPLST